MADPWADRITLNPPYTPTRDAQVSMPGPTEGTVGDGLNLTDSDDTASCSDISNSFETRTLDDFRVPPLPF